MSTIIELFCSCCDTLLADDDISLGVCGTCGAPSLEPIQNVTVYAEPFTLSGELG